MANSTREECVFPYTVQSWFSLATTGMILLAGLSLQSFIVAVHVIDWLKGRSMTAVDQIITSLGIMRIIFLLSVPSHYLSYNCSATFLLLNLFTGITSGFSSVWLSALLSALFCFSITTFNNVFFLHLKTIISQRVLCLIFASVLLGSGYAFTLLLWISYATHKNLSYSEMINDNLHFPVVFSANCFWNIFPVLMFFASSVLLVLSLGFHIRQMKHHGNVMGSTDTYHKMIMFSTLSFLTCALSCVVNLTERYGIKLFGILGMYAFWNVFPLLHSVSLVYATTKLRNEFFRILQCLMDCLLWNKASEPDSREQFEVTRL